MMKITKSIIARRLATLNSMQGTKYIADYNPVYGGWSMHYVCNEYGGLSSGDFGFDDRKSTREFFNYLVGIIAGLWYAERNKDTNKK